MRGFKGAQLALVTGDDRPRLRNPNALDVAPAPEPTRWTPEREASPSIQRALLLAADRLWRSRDDAARWTTPRSGGPGLQARLLLTLIALGLDDGDRADRLADGLLESQLPGGGWAGTLGEAYDHAASVLAYFALKLHRGSAALPRLREARQVILAHGGAHMIDDEPHAWLALFRQVPARKTVSKQVWSDAVGTGIQREFDALHGVRELLTASAQTASNVTTEPSKPCRAIELLWQRIDVGTDEGEVLDAVERELESLIHDDQNEEVYLAPESTKEHDTARMIEALAPLGYREELAPSVTWLAARAEQVHAQQSPATVAAMLHAFAAWQPVDEKQDSALPPRLRIIDDEAFLNAEQQSEKAFDPDAVVEQLITWIVAEQSSVGSWKDVPTTAVVVKALTAYQLDNAEVKAAVERGAAWLAGEQSDSGAWQANVTTTAAVVDALTAAGEESDAPLAGINWLLSEQQADGGWGASEDARPAVTAGVLKTLATGMPHADAAAQAAHLLLDTQQRGGEWGDPLTTCAIVQALTRWVRESRDTPLANTPVRLRVVAEPVETEAAYA